MGILVRPREPAQPRNGEKQPVGDRAFRNLPVRRKQSGRRAVDGIDLEAPGGGAPGAGPLQTVSSGLGNYAIVDDAGARALRNTVPIPTPVAGAGTVGLVHRS
jgi:hypothetical protein